MSNQIPEQVLPVRGQGKRLRQRGRRWGVKLKALYLKILCSYLLAQNSTLQLSCWTKQNPQNSILPNVTCNKLNRLTEIRNGLEPGLYWMGHLIEIFRNVQLSWRRRVQEGWKRVVNTLPALYKETLYLILLFNKPFALYFWYVQGELEWERKHTPCTIRLASSILAALVHSL